MSSLGSPHGRQVPNQVEPHDEPSQSLVIAVEEGLAVHGFNQPMMYWGAYEGAHWVITSWNEDSDMVYNHH